MPADVFRPISAVIIFVVIQKTVQLVQEIARHFVITTTEGVPEVLKTVITRQRIVLPVHLRLVRIHAAMPMKIVQTVSRIVHRNAIAATEFAALKKVTLTVRGTATIMVAGYSRRQTRSPEAPGLLVLLVRQETRVMAIMSLLIIVNRVNQKFVTIITVPVYVCRLPLARRRPI